jgi:hypothetical protein
MRKPTDNANTDTKKRKKGVQWSSDVTGSGEIPSITPQEEHNRNNELQKVALQVQLAHSSYLCPGLHDPGSLTDVQIVTFDDLFSPSAPPIYIPLFQRTYCWVDQIDGWWRDVVGVSDEHRVGKVILKRSHQYDDGRAIVCIDGQQRITTQSLLLAAIRDSLLNIRDTILIQNVVLLDQISHVTTINTLNNHLSSTRKMFVAHKTDSHQSHETHSHSISPHFTTMSISPPSSSSSPSPLTSAPSSSPSPLTSAPSSSPSSSPLTSTSVPKSTSILTQPSYYSQEHPTYTSNLSFANSLISTIDKYLFRDVNASESWVSHTLQALMTNTKQWNEIFSLGEKLSFTTLLPSFCDRVAFFELILFGKVNSALRLIKLKHQKIMQQQQQHQHQQQQQQQPLFIQNGIQISLKSSESKMAKAKQIFTEKLIHRIPHLSRINSFLSSRLHPQNDTDVVMKDGNEETLQTTEGGITDLDISLAIQAISNLLRSAQQKVSLARVEIITPINFAQVRI